MYLGGFGLITGAAGTRMTTIVYRPFRRYSLALQPGKPAVLKSVLNRCSKRYKAVHNCDNLVVLGMTAKWQNSRGIRKRAWRDSNPRPAA
jgi:hypothetical protein